MFGLGYQELLLILVIVLVLFLAALADWISAQVLRGYTRLGASLREQLAPRLGFSAPVQPLCTATVSVRPDVSFALPSAQPLASRAPKTSGTATRSASEETGGFDGVAPTGTFTGRVWARRASPKGRSSGIGSSGPAHASAETHGIPPRGCDR
jgi:hypothetical protein